jgi:hypothetical protein
MRNNRPVTYDTHSVEATAYYQARSRCSDTKRRDYARYGGRGIKFLFTSGEQWFSELGIRPSAQHSVDRINNDGNYEPGNVRWATKEEQTNNRRLTITTPMLGKKHMRETRDKMSESHKARYAMMTEEEKKRCTEACRLARKNIPLTEAHKVAMSIAAKKRWSSAEARTKQSERMRACHSGLV